MVQERGDRGIEFGNRNDPQLCKNSLGGMVFRNEIFPKNSVQEKPAWEARMDIIGSRVLASYSLAE